MGARQPRETVQHPVLGRVLPLPGALLRMEVPLLDPYEALRYQEGLALAKAFNNPHLFLPQQISYREGLICGGQGAMQLDFEDFRANLSGDVMDRSLAGRRYSPQEMVRVLYLVAGAMRDFEQAGLKFGNVHPDSVLLEGQELRVVNRYSWPGIPVGIQKILESSRGSYVSPQQLRDLERRMVYEVDSDPGRNDGFGLGMLWLEMGTLTSSEDLYDFYKSEVLVGREKGQARRSQFREAYGDRLLQSLLDNLLEEDRFRRPSPGQVHASLRPYESQILHGQPFVPDLEVMRQSVRQFDQGLS